jgi:hypothetical protein
VRWCICIGLFGSREIGPGRESLIDRHSCGRYHQSRNRDTEQCGGTQYRCYSDGHRRSPCCECIWLILREYEFVRFFIPTAFFLFLPRTALENVSIFLNFNVLMRM